MRYYIIWNNVMDAPHYAFDNGLGPVLYPTMAMAKRRIGQLAGRQGKYFKVEGRTLRRSATKQEDYRLSYEVREAVLEY